ncbi:hypothetical protein D3C87_2065350 [compost metagenome]
MRDMQPAFGCLDRSRALAVLHFFNRMIVAFVNDDFLGDYRIFNRIGQSPADAAA